MPGIEGQKPVTHFLKEGIGLQVGEGGVEHIGAFELQLGKLL